MITSFSPDDKDKRVSGAYKTELAPNRTQVVLLRKHAHAARFAWNWGLGRKLEVMDFNRLPTIQMKVPTAIDLHRELNRLKKTSHPWLYEVSKCAPQEALRNLDRAFKNLYESHMGFPRFKKKTWAKPSFKLTDPITVADNAIRLPRLGWIRLKERGYLLPEGAVHITGATVSEEAGRWFVSLHVSEEREHVEVPENAPKVGIDRGLKTLATVGNETFHYFIENPKPLSKMERKLNRAQRAVSHKEKGSKNRAKAVRRLQRVHLRIANVRVDAIHKATTMMAKARAIYVVETLNVRAMMGNRHLAKSIADVGWSEFVRQLKYKAERYGSRVIEADPFFPSSQLCSVCGGRHPEMKDPSARTLTCECGWVADRDVNAVINLSRWPSVGRTLETPVRAERSQSERTVLGDEAGNTTMAHLSMV